ncbi:MAG: UvrD-helicase domain-containing protein [Bacteroidales bacterium]|nr:UvrD-helicase domain-containing protein [Bacteroidales bacterium]
MSAHNPFVICKAAAGSGKTFNLVKEYLKLAMAGGLAGVETRFRGILAITFTNKAANEMKERIMVYLEQIEAYGVDPEKSKMGAPLLEALNAERSASLPPFDETQLRQMAARLRSAILHRYSDLSVCTIDSFMHRVVRTFAHDLGQPVNFEVMIEQDDLIDQAVSRLMSLVGTAGNEALTDVVQHYAVSRMEDEKGFDIEWSLRKLAKQLFSEGTDEFLESLRRYSMGDYVEMYRHYEADNHVYLRKMEALGQEAVELLESAGMTADRCVGGKTGFLAFFQKMSHFEQTLRGKLTYKPNAKVAGLFAAVDYSGDTLCKDKSQVPEADRIAPRLLQIFNELENLLGDPLTDYNTRSVLLRELYAMALLGELDRQLHDYAKENEVVHLSDFNRLINKIVMEEPAPFIYERLGNRYHHFLIDEFQDTSVLQWHNLVPLLDNGVGQGHESLVVGDGKQAIYRFRQGDVRQFVALPKVEGLPLHGDALSHPDNFRMQHLDVNFRTADAVVDFNNDFFSWLVRNRYGDNELARKIYLGPEGDCKVGDEELRQKHNEKKAQRPEGHVGVRFVDAEDPEAVCREVLAIIDRLVGEQSYCARDIMILGRNKADLAAVGNYLLANSRYEQCSAESFYLRGSQVVLTLVAALRCLHDGADRMAAAELLQRLFMLGILRNSHDDAFMDDETVDLRQALASEGIDFDAGRLLSTDLYDCCEELVRTLRLDQLDVPYVASLLNKVASFALRHPQGIGDFLEWFDEHPDLSAASSSEGNALRLMTIHKAKGLEAPVVICPFFKPSTHLTTLWVNAAERFAPYEKSLPAAYVTLGKDSTRFDGDRDKEKDASAVDDLNILYVAFTRPQEQLFVVAPQPKEGSATVSYASLLHEYTKGDADYGDPDFTHVEEEKKREEKAPEEAFIRRLSYIDWTDKVKIASQSEKALTPLMEERVRFGIHAHALMAGVEHGGDVDGALERYATQQTLDDEERKRLETLAREVVAHPATARFFDPAYKVKNECDLTDGSVSGRPDRVVFTPDETWVVDFKTGVDLGEEYDRQLRHYCHALTAMGYPAVSGWLVFLQPQIQVRQTIV